MNDLPSWYTRHIKPSEIVAAREWYAQHNGHVDAILKAHEQTATRAAYAPSGSDCANPALWKPEHWKWLFT